MIRPIALPYPRYKIEDGHIKADALVSISSPIPDPNDREIPKENFGEILALQFDDIASRAIIKAGGCLCGPSHEHIRQALEFAQKTRTEKENPSIAVHCQAGLSRSPAIALAINAAKDPGKEEEVVDSLLAYDPTEQFCFNPHIIALADDMLKTGGAIEKHLWILCPRYRSWKNYWTRENTKLGMPKQFLL